MDINKIDASLAHLSDMVGMGEFDEAFNDVEGKFSGECCYITWRPD